MQEQLEKLLTRNNIVWALGFVASVLSYVLAHTSLIPAGWQEHMRDIAAVLGFLTGKLGMSPLVYTGPEAAPQGYVNLTKEGV